MTEGQTRPEPAQPTVFAVVVTFNPDVSVLLRNLEAVRPQVHAVVVVDNGSDNNVEVSTAAEGIEAQFIGLPENRGIAHALNAGCTHAESGGATAVLLLDQDSISTARMVDRLTKQLTAGYDISAPRILDRNLNEDDISTHAVEDVNYCITSGSLVSLRTWRSTGGYDERLFIDFVDFDFCLRVRLAGGRIAKCGDATLDHAIGQSTQHGKFIAYHHSAFRTEHMAADMIAYAKKHRKAPKHLRVSGRGLFATYLILIRKAFIIARFESDRAQKLTSLGRGMLSGTLRRMA